MRQPHAGRRSDGIGDGRQRRHDRRLTHAAHAIGMAGIGHLDDDRINHRHVGCHGNTVIEEAWVLQASVLVVPVLLVERPSNPLNGATLHLAFDVAWMYRLASVLHHGIAQNLYSARVWIDLDVADVRAKAHTGTVGVVFKMPRDRSARTRKLRRNLIERKGFELPRIGSCWPRHAVLPGYRVRRDPPNRGGARAEDLDGVARRVDHPDPGGEGHPTAVGHVVVPEG